jgi:hypothetical protein
VHTQTIDGFFGLFKTGVRGAHHPVSHKWLQGYWKKASLSLTGGAFALSMRHSTGWSDIEAACLSSEGILPRLTGERVFV